jgi:mannose-6-phosphate isomerase-like protein (cupin superfamily)
LVVSGSALVTNGDGASLLVENLPTCIPLAEIHSLENNSKALHKIIMITGGSALEEDSRYESPISKIETIKHHLENVYVD